MKVDVEYGSGLHSACPNCATALVSAFSSVPWCPRCEWNLGCFEPERRHPELGWRWLDRVLFNVAYRLSRELYQALPHRPLRPRGLTGSGLAITGIAVLMFAMWLWVTGCGCWLILDDTRSWRVAPGVALLLIAVQLRPRFARLPRGLPTLDRQSAPVLFRLIDRIAVEAGTAVPHVVAVTPFVEAFGGVIGLRQRRVLGIGLPLWVSLNPQERVAVIAHELGHFAGGDPRRLLATQPAYQTLSTLAEMTRPTLDADGVFRRVARHLGNVVSNGFQLAQLLVMLMGHRDAQRAEYRADEVAALVAGGPAAVGMLDACLTAEPIMVAVTRSARAGRAAARDARRTGVAASPRNEAREWALGIATARDEAAPRLSVRRQLSVRDEVSVYADHPPTGLRIRRLLTLPTSPARVVLTPRESRRIDTELAPCYERFGRDLALT